MRYSKQKSTGKLLETQGGGDPNNPLHLSTMIQNAVNAGINESDIEVGYADDSVVSGWFKTQDEEAMGYADKRKAEYPSIPDQLDDIYHNGIDAWKATIKVTKDKYPK
jgi:hypothetical protein|tara:strand:+ start:847 stop:1170 length:324 start_codon:yes stop_codon:yes gene_type:complete